MASGSVRTFDRNAVAQSCASEALAMREYAIFLDNFKGQVQDNLNSEELLQEIYMERAPEVPPGKVKNHFVGNDFKGAGKKRLHEMDSAARKIQKFYRAYRIRKRWLSLVTRMVSVSGAGDSESRMVPVTLFESMRRSRRIARLHQAASGQGAPIDTRVGSFARGRKIVHSDIPDW